MTSFAGGAKPEERLGAAYQQANIGDTVFAVQDGTQYIDQRSYQGGGPEFSVEPFPLNPPAAPTAMLRRRPSWLLAARNQIVDFTGRAKELDSLSAWRDDSEIGIAARLVHGPGGQGKTRLAAKFAHQSAGAGWKVALARHRSDPTRSTSHLEPQQLAGTAGLLVVVDYAERWPRGDLLNLFQEPLLHQGLRARVLLLARPAGQWWASLQHPLDSIDVIADHLLLLPLADSAQQRRMLFDAARDRFAALLGAGDSEQIGPPGPLDAEGYRLVLTIHMAALAAVNAHARNDKAPADPAELSAYLLDRERDHWQAMYDNDQRVTTRPVQLARAVLVATLAGPLAYPDGVAVLGRVRVDPAAQVAGDHAICYPPADPATILEPLYPDRLGEDFLALQTPGHQTSYHADPWAATAVSQLVTAAADSESNEPTPPPAYAGRTITVLAEASKRWPHLSDHLQGILRARPTLAIAAGGATLMTLAATVPIDLLEAIEPHLPTGRHVDLDTAVAAISQRLTSHRLDHTRDPATRALLLATLDNRLANAGLHQQALAHAEEAVEIYRRLAAVNPAAHEPTFAGMMANLGVRLSALGRREEALTAAQKAVEILRRLAAANPAAHEPDLATSLSNLSVDLGNLGRREEALAAAEEAVEVYRRLAAVNPAAHEATFAAALANLGLGLSALERREEALTAAQKAVEILRRLAAANPAAHEPDLATSLSNLSIYLGNLGRREEALAAAEEAVEVYRRLAAVNPAAHEPDLAMGLNNLGGWLWELGNPEEALAAAEEAVEIRRRLAAVNPAAHEAVLAGSLSNLGVGLSALGRVEEALAATQKAVEVHRRLAAVNPAAHEPDLAMALNNLGIRLSALGRQEEALAATEEAVELNRRLAAANSAVYEPNLANALVSFGLVRSVAEVELDEALRALEEAIGIYERLAVALPNAFVSRLVGAFWRAADVLDQMGRTEEAEAIRRQLSADDDASDATTIG